jgi:hypothetical protein
MDAAAQVKQGWLARCAAAAPCVPARDRAGRSSLHRLPRVPQEVMATFPDVRLAYGESDEFSFVLPPSTAVYGQCRGTAGVKRQGSLCISLGCSERARVWCMH